VGGIREKSGRTRVTREDSERKGRARRRIPSVSRRERGAKEWTEKGS